MKVKSKKSLRVKMVKLIFKQFALDHLFNQFNDDWNVELQTKLKDTFSFRCELHKFETINSRLTGQICLEKENGETSVIDFIVQPTGKIFQTF